MKNSFISHQLMINCLTEAQEQSKPQNTQTVKAQPSAITQERH